MHVFTYIRIYIYVYPHIYLNILGILTEKNRGKQASGKKKWSKNYISTGWACRIT